MIHDLHFLILTSLHEIDSFSLAFSSEAIPIDQIGAIAP